MKTPIYAGLLKAFRKLYQELRKTNLRNSDCIRDPLKASEIIYHKLISDEPCMIARFGSNELNVVINYLSIKSKSKSILKYMRNEQFDWWWNDGVIKNLHEVAGFFPPSVNKVEQFCELMFHLGLLRRERRGVVRL